MIGVGCPQMLRKSDADQGKEGASVPGHPRWPGPVGQEQLGEDAEAGGRGGDALIGSGQRNPDVAYPRGAVQLTR
jgi:hypothetical protein